VHEYNKVHDTQFNLWIYFMKQISEIKYHAHSVKRRGTYANHGSENRWGHPAITSDNTSYETMRFALDSRPIANLIKSGWQSRELITQSCTSRETRSTRRRIKALLENAILDREEINWDSTVPDQTSPFRAPNHRASWEHSMHSSRPHLRVYTSPNPYCAPPCTLYRAPLTVSM
jgi:hypothetical protein